MDITYTAGQEKFNYRVCAVMISGNKILAMHDERSPYFYLPGGRNSRRAMKADFHCTLRKDRSVSSFSVLSSKCRGRSKMLSFKNTG